MANDWRKAEVSDLNTLKMIDGKVYKGVAEAMLVDGDYETQVRWHLASRREIASYTNKARGVRAQYITGAGHTSLKANFNLTDAQLDAMLSGAHI